MLPAGVIVVDVGGGVLDPPAERTGTLDPTNGASDGRSRTSSAVRTVVAGVFGALAAAGIALGTVGR